MKKTALIALGLLLALAVGVRGEFKTGGPPTAATNYSSLESRLGLTKHQIALQRRSYEPKAAVCFFFDDADTSFFTDVVVVADSIHSARGWDDATRIRATTGVIISNTGTGSAATWAQIATIKDRQDEFELALHGNSSERFGSIGAGHSRSRADSMLAAWQDSMVAHVGFECAGVMLPNHRTTLPYQNTFAKNNISWVVGLRVPINADTANASSGGPLANEQSPMDVNYDPWPMASAGLTSTDYMCYQRPGGISNRWNIGRRDSWKNSADTLQEYKDAISLAVQTTSMVLFTNHAVGDTTGAGAGDTGSYLDLMMSRDDLVNLFDYVADLMDEGVLEPLTGSQMVDRGTGHVVGRLNPHYEFAIVQDYDASTALPNTDFVPLSFPLSMDVNNFYMAGNETLTVAGGTAENWKLASADTVLGAYTVESLADSVSYGATSPSGRVLVAAAPSGNTYRTDTFPIIIRTTGVQAGHIEVSIQALTFGGESDDFMPMIRLHQWDEMFGDFVNPFSAGYDFMVQSSKTGPFEPWTGAAYRWDPKATRVRPQFYFTPVDTNLYGANLPGTGATNTSREMFTFSRGLVPVFMTESQGAVDIHAPFGDHTNLEGTTGANESYMVNVVTARDQIINGTNYGRAYWITYLFRVPIVPNDTDWVAGHVYWRYIGDAPAATVEVIVSDVAAWAPY